MDVGAFFFAGPAGLAVTKGVPGRFQAVREGQPFSVVVDYSHTPDSLENALRDTLLAAPILALLLALTLAVVNGNLNRTPFDVLPLALFSHVATSCGVVGLDSSTLVPECPLAPELLQSSGQHPIREINPFSVSDPALLGAFCGLFE